MRLVVIVRDPHVLPAQRTLWTRTPSPLFTSRLAGTSACRHVGPRPVRHGDSTGPTHPASAPPPPCGQVSGSAPAPTPLRRLVDSPRWRTVPVWRSDSRSRCRAQPPAGPPARSARPTRRSAPPASRHAVQTEGSRSRAPLPPERPHRHPDRDDRPADLPSPVEPTLWITVGGSPGSGRAERSRVPTSNSTVRPSDDTDTATRLTPPNPGRTRRGAPGKPVWSRPGGSSDSRSRGHAPDRAEAHAPGRGSLVPRSWYPRPSDSAVRSPPGSGPRRSGSGSLVPRSWHPDPSPGPGTTDARARARPRTRRSRAPSFLGRGTPRPAGPPTPRGMHA